MDSHQGHGAGPDKPDKPDKPDEHEGCAAFGPLLEAFYHHALAPEQARSVAEHAAGCAQCRTALADFAALDRLIAASPAPQPGPELRRRVTARIATARAQRPNRLANPATSTPIERNAIVNDVNDTRDANDAPWARAETQATRAGKGMQRLRVLLGTAAAALIVALIAGVLVTRPQGPASGIAPGTPTPGQVNQTSTATPDQGNTTNSAQFTQPAGKCDPTKITAKIPAHALLFDLAMVSPDEGWAVGAIESAADSGGPVNALILHYKNCAWTPVAMNYPGATLLSISMTSATDGWAVGGSGGNGRQLALHYTGGAWHQATLPGENSFQGVYNSVKMRAANEGWIVIQRPKNSQGVSVFSLLHLMNGRWTMIDSPPALIRVNDLLPVGPNEAWMAGVQNANRQLTPVLYHYQGGSWTSAALPAGVEVNWLRMVSPNDIWASGHINASTNVEYAQSAAVLRYDGSAWRQVDAGASGHPQFIQAFDSATSWAFSINPDLSVDTINGAQYQRNGTWLRMEWPFTNVNMGLAPFGMSPMQRISADEYWTLGFINSASGQRSLLLYFANGAWHEYGAD